MIRFSDFKSSAGAVAATLNAKSAHFQTVGSLYSHNDRKPLLQQYNWSERGPINIT